MTVVVLLGVVYLSVLISVLPDGAESLIIFAAAAAILIVVVIVGLLDLAPADSAIVTAVPLGIIHVSHGCRQDTFHEFLVLGHLIESAGNLFHHNEVRVVGVQLKEFLQVFMGQSLLSDSLFLEEFKEVFGSHDLNCVLFGLSLNQLLVDGSLEEVIERNIKLHKCEHQLSQDLYRLLVKLGEVENRPSISLLLLFLLRGGLISILLAAVFVVHVAVFFVAVCLSTAVAAVVLDAEIVHNDYELSEQDRILEVCFSQHTHQACYLDLLQIGDAQFFHTLKESDG